MFVRAYNREYFPCYVLVPHCQQNNNWSSRDINNEATTPMQMTLALVEKTEKELAIDRHRIYLAGISEGGRGVWEAGIRYPHTFAALVPVASAWAFDEEQMKRIKKSAVWISSGTLDSDVPIQYVRLMASRLSGAGLDIKYQEYPRIGHLSWIPLSFDEEFLPWLFSKWQ